MKMRNIMSTLVVLLLATTLSTAQSLEEGIKMYNYERYTSAKKQLEPLAAGDAMANYYLGLSELALGNIDKAQAIFSKYPEHYANMGGMARVQFTKGNTAAGMKLATELQEKGRKKDWEPDMYAADAITYTKGGDKQIAVNWYNDILEREQNAKILISAGDAYQQLNGGGGKAMNSYEKAAGLDTKNSLAYSRIGRLWYNAQNYDLALENWKKAQEADPSNPLPYYDLANAYTYVQKYQIAKENLEKYLERSDKSEEDMVRYVELLYLAKDCDAAISKINELKAKGIFKFNFYGIMAYCYMENKDSASAVKALENIRLYFQQQSKDKIYTLDYLNYGRIALKNELSDTANAYFVKALAMDTTDNKAATYREIGESFKDNKSWTNAGNWYKRIIDEYKDKATATDYFWSGVSYYYGQNYELADTVFAQMISAYPDQPSGPYWRGRVNAAIDNEGETGAAVPYYTQWLKMADESEEYNPKPNDMMQAYQYLALHYYKKYAADKKPEDKELCLNYVAKIQTINADDKLAEQIKGAIKSLDNPQ